MWTCSNRYISSHNRITFVQKFDSSESRSQFIFIFVVWLVVVFNHPYLVIVYILPHNFRYFAHYSHYSHIRFTCTNVCTAVRSHILLSSFRFENYSFFLLFPLLFSFISSQRATCHIAVEAN